jgi:hypothetical protein
MATAVVRATAELHTSDLRALRGIELHAGVELHKDELHSSEQQGDITLKARVSNVCFECFSYFRGMLQMFGMDVAKVDWNVAYVANVCPQYFMCF